MVKLNYSRQRPPRHLSLYSQAVLLCSGIYSTLGWIFVGFGMILFWVFTYNSTAMLWLSPNVDWENGQGIIIKIENTNASEKEENIYSLTYNYFANGQKYTGKGYMIDDDLMEGDEVAIQFNPKNVLHSRLTNGRQKMFSTWAIFAVIFPLIGLGMLFYGIKANYKALKLIKIGHFSTGQVLSKEPTGGNVSINEINFPIYKYEFQFFVKGSARIAKCQTYKAHLVEDEVEEFILYDYVEPNINAVYDAITNAPELDSLGQMKQVSFKKYYLLIAPILTLLIHIPWAYFVLS